MLNSIELAALLEEMNPQSSASDLLNKDFSAITPTQEHLDVLEAYLELYKQRQDEQKVQAIQNKIDLIRSSLQQ